MIKLKEVINFSPKKNSFWIITLLLILPFSIVTIPLFTKIFRRFKEICGPYGMGYGTITFTNFATDETQGEYFGYFMTQVQDNLFRGTTNGIWKKEGSKIKTFAYDNDKVGSVINLATGTWDLVSRKAKFTVAPLVD